MPIILRAASNINIVVYDNKMQVDSHIYEFLKKVKTKFPVKNNNKGEVEEEEEQ